MNVMIINIFEIILNMVEAFLVGSHFDQGNFLSIHAWVGFLSFGKIRLHLLSGKIQPNPKNPKVFEASQLLVA